MGAVSAEVLNQDIATKCRILNKLSLSKIDWVNIKKNYSLFHFNLIQYRYTNLSNEEKFGNTEKKKKKSMNIRINFDDKKMTT